MTGLGSAPVSTDRARAFSGNVRSGPSGRRTRSSGSQVAPVRHRRTIDAAAGGERGVVAAGARSRRRSEKRGSAAWSPNSTYARGAGIPEPALQAPRPRRAGGDGRLDWSSVQVPATSAGSSSVEIGRRRRRRRLIGRVVPGAFG